MEGKLAHFNSIRNRLIELAKVGGLTTYSDLERDCSIPNRNPGDANVYLFNLLYDLGSIEALFDRPPINALVVRKKEKTPGQGFYNWVRLRLNHFDKRDPSEALGDFRVECSKFWSDEENYRQFSGSISIEYVKK